MIFQTKISGIPCKCEVILTPETIQMNILDVTGSPSSDLTHRMTSDDAARLQEEFQLEVQGERYGYLM